MSSEAAIPGELAVEASISGVSHEVTGIWTPG